MNEYIVIEDRCKLICYAILNIVATMVLMVVSSYFFTQGAFLIVFLLVTIIWFSLKAMFRYGRRAIKNTPVCEFKRDVVILYTSSKETIIMKYKDIKEVKILRDFKSVKLFFAGDTVTHPSGWYYAGAIYLFQRKLLKEVEENTKRCLDSHKVTYSCVEKTSARADKQ